MVDIFTFYSREGAAAATVARMTMASGWVTPTLHDARRSVDLVRWTIAIVLLTHPAHALLHPEDARALAAGLAAQGVPAALGVAWSALAIQLACALALTARRFAAPAALGSIAVLAGGAALLYAPRWWVVGGRAEDGAPGVELHVLLTGCLAAIAWAAWPRGDRARREDRGFELIRLVSAAMLVPHGAAAFVTWDVEGMRGWGEAMELLGFPCGVALVWSIKGLELVSSVARIARRLIVPACVGNLAVLLPGMWISHHLAWFDVGPGENGIEYSVVLSACAIACILAYAPVRRSRPALGR